MLLKAREPKSTGHEDMRKQKCQCKKTKEKIIKEKKKEIEMEEKGITPSDQVNEGRILRKNHIREVS